MIVNEILLKLQGILDANDEKRGALIFQFQESVWNEIVFDNKDLEEFLSTLAYDMDFYVAKAHLRKESASYYGNKRLFDEVNRAINYIENNDH